MRCGKKPQKAVITENSVHISTSILVARRSQISSMDISFLLAKPIEVKDWQSLPSPGHRMLSSARSSAAKESGFGSADQKKRHFRSRKAKRRVAGIGGVIPRPAESLPRAPVPATKRELIVVATMISRMIGTSVFSDRTEFSVTTGQEFYGSNSRPVGNYSQGLT